MHVASQLAELLLVAWLPGAVLFRLPWGDRDRRAALDAEERLFWTVVLSLALSLSVVLGLATVGRYSFNRLLAADALAAVVLAALSRGRLRLGAAASRPGPTAALPIVLMCLGGWLYFPTAEYIIGGKDPGTYVNEGVQIAQRGTLEYRDPVVATVPAFARDLFFPRHEGAQEYGVRFMGFFLMNPDTGAVVGQFPHLFPASIAIGYGIDGLNGALRTIGVWAMLGLLAVYFAGARVFGPVPASAGAVLLALNVIEVWFGRYPNAELPMQALLFAALLANARAHVDRDGFFAPVAGVLLGLLLFLRIDGVVVVAAVGAATGLAAIAGQRPRALFLFPVGVAGVLAAIYVLGPLRAYTAVPIYFLQKLAWWQYALLFLAAIAGTAIVAIGLRLPAIGARIRSLAPPILVGVTVVAAAYAMWLREPAGRLALMDAYALRMFTAWYLSLPVLLAALVGLALHARRGFWRDPALLVTGLGFAFLYFYKIRIVPEHFWMTRRFVPVILPFALMLASFAAVGGTRGGWPGARRLRPLLGWIFLALVAASYMRASRPVIGHVEYQGMTARLEKLAGLVSDSDLAVVESRDAASDVHTLGLPLAYIYARNVLLLHSPRPDKATFAEFLEWAHTRYARVLFIGAGGTDLLSYRYGVRSIASERFQVPEYASPVNDYPRFARRKEFDFGVYEFTPPRVLDGGWFDLDVGLNDDLHVLRFHAKETSEGHTFRWTRATSYLSITTLRPDAREVSLTMADGGRPPGAPPADVTVYLHGELLGKVHVAGKFRPYTFAIPPALASRAAAFRDPVELRLVTTLWNPHAVLGAPDERDLGVMLDRVAVR